MSEITFKPFTLVFDKDIRDIKENPFHIETVFGTPIAISRGDLTVRTIELEEEIAALKEAAEQRQMLYEGRFKELVEARLLSAGPDGKGGFDINVQGQVVPLLAEQLAACFKASGGENYVEYEVHHPELGIMAFNLQRKAGVTPAQKAARLEAENKALREALEPFALVGTYYDDQQPGPRVSDEFIPVVNVGDCRRARAALKTTGNDG